MIILLVFEFLLQLGVCLFLVTQFTTNHFQLFFELAFSFFLGIFDFADLMLVFGTY